MLTSKGGLRRKITIKIKCPACFANHILASHEHRTRADLQADGR
jgi:ribosomal protein S27AE